MSHAFAQPTPVYNEYVGIVEEVARVVTTIKPGQFVIGSGFAYDNTCEICRAADLVVHPDGDREPDVGPQRGADEAVAEVGRVGAGMTAR